MTAPSREDRAIAADLLRWFGANARALPWRQPGPAGLRRDPYRVLVSEIMLQQTQVPRVVQRFHEFLARFPGVAALAAADEDDVLHAWTGMGYYRRARLLHAAARAIAERHGGVVPNDPAALRALPGVGAYTAGAIAAFAFNLPQPAVDTNVGRVLLRLGGVERPVEDARSRRYVAERAGALAAAAADRAGDLSESLIELGALVCVAGVPRCEVCPVARRCAAFRTGRQALIPPPSKKAARSVTTHRVYVIEDARGRLLVERRPERGLWSKMWQAPTLEAAPRPTPAAVRAFEKALGLRRATRTGSFVHDTTHREVRFEVCVARIADEIAPGGRRWASRADLERLAMSTPMRAILLGPATPLGGTS